jgi:hypothetical protein
MIDLSATVVTDVAVNGSASAWAQEDDARLVETKSSRVEGNFN